MSKLYRSIFLQGTKNQGHGQRGVSNLIFKKKIYRYMKFSTIYTGYIAKFLVLTNRFVSKYQYLQTVRLGMNVSTNTGYIKYIVSVLRCSVCLEVAVFVMKLYFRYEKKMEHEKKLTKHLPSHNRYCCTILL